jgi:hypothetical protein
MGVYGVAMRSRMKREDALSALRFAGYHGDQRAFVRVYVENRISRKVACEEFNRGADLRRSGVRCTCFECKGTRS